MSQITTVTFMEFPQQHRWWAFTRMGRLPNLDKVPGLRFYQMMGSGAGQGFSIWPDFSTYVFFAVWKDETQADLFLNKHAVMADFNVKTEHLYTVYMLAVKAHGLWHKKNPFEIEAKSLNGPVVVLTRATIRPLKAFSFWKNVGKVSQSISKAEGLIYAKGVGEYPIFMQATISFWKELSSVHTYAYQRQEHATVIKKTRQLDWYSEELFANFVVLKISGDKNILSPFF